MSSSSSALALLVSAVVACSADATDAPGVNESAVTTARKPARADFCISRDFVQNTNAVFDPDDISAKEEKSKFTVAEERLEANAYWMAVAARLAYQEKKDTETEMKAHWGTTRFRWFEEHRSGIDTQAFLAEITHNPSKDIPPRTVDLGDGTTEEIPGSVSVGDMTIISFRGTEKKRDDWATDLNSNLVPLPDRSGASLGLVHDGFATALDVIWPDLLAEAKRTKRPIFLTGHSLGAAVATLAAARLIAEDDPGIEVAALYTFGSPRVGQQDFADNFNQLRRRHGMKLRRYVNKNDAVTMVPNKVIGALGSDVNQLFLSGWRHVGQHDGRDDRLVWYDREWTPFTNAAASERMTTTRWLSQIGPSWIDDHSMNRYVAKTEITAFLRRTACPGDAGPTDRVDGVVR